VPQAVAINELEKLKNPKPIARIVYYSHYLRIDIYIECSRTLRLGVFPGPGLVIEELVLRSDLRVIR